MGRKKIKEGKDEKQKFYSPLFKSRYLDMDLSKMEEEEYNKIKKGVYLSISARIIGGILLLIFCIVIIASGGSTW